MRTSMITEKEELEDIINNCDICFAGLIESDGSPYVIPMNFGYNNNTLILHSAPEGKHIHLLNNDPRICITFCSDRELKYQHPDVACSYSMLSRSVICKGKVEFIEDLSEKEAALNILMANYTDRPFQYSIPALRNVKVWKVDIQEMTGKSFGQNFR